jgi:hypothetical protein
MSSPAKVYVNDCSRLLKGQHRSPMRFGVIPFKDYMDTALSQSMDNQCRTSTAQRDRVKTLLAMETYIH